MSSQSSSNFPTLPPVSPGLAGVFNFPSPLPLPSPITPLQETGLPLQETSVAGSSFSGAGLLPHATTNVSVQSLHRTSSVFTYAHEHLGQERTPLQSSIVDPSVLQREVSHVLPRLSPTQVPSQYLSCPISQQLPTTFRYPPSCSDNRNRGPGYYTSCFRLSHSYAQQPPVVSWITHRQPQPFQPMGPFYNSHAPHPPVQHQNPVYSFFPQGPHGISPYGEVSMQIHQTRMQYTATPPGMMMFPTPAYPPPSTITSQVFQPQLHHLRPEQSTSRPFYPHSLMPPHHITPAPQSILDLIGMSPERYLGLEEKSVYSSPSNSGQCSFPPCTLAAQCTMEPQEQPESISQDKNVSKSRVVGEEQNSGASSMGPQKCEISQGISHKVCPKRNNIVRPIPVYAKPGSINFTSGVPHSEVPPAPKKKKTAPGVKAKKPTRKPSIAARPCNISLCNTPSLNLSVIDSSVDNSCSDGDNIAVEQVIEVVTDEPAISKEVATVQLYKDFVQDFKSHCSTLGYSLNDVIQQIAIRYGQIVSLQYITDFEQLKLPKKSYSPLMILLNTWIKDTAKAAGSSEQDPLSKIVMISSGTGINPQRARRKKTVVSVHVTTELEKEFAKKKNPTPTAMQKMANRLSVEKDYVQSWFCNHRRRDKCEGKRPLAKRGAAVQPKIPNIAAEMQKRRIPSKFYDITIEVPSFHPRDIGSPVHANYTVPV